MFRNKDIERQLLKEGGGDSSVKIMTTKTIFDPQGKFLRRWNIIFVLSCAIAVSVDPLFCYLPVINIPENCIELDKNLWITTIVLRSVNDIIYLMHIIFQFRTGFINKEREKLGKGLNTDAWEIAMRYLGRYFLIDILAILPIPQVRERLLFNYIIYRQTMFTSCCNLTSESGFTEINHYLFLGKTFSICFGVWYGGKYKSIENKLHWLQTFSKLLYTQQTIVILYLSNQKVGEMLNLRIFNWISTLAIHLEHFRHIFSPSVFCYINIASSTLW